MNRTANGRRVAIILLLAVCLIAGGLIAFELRQPDLFVRSLALPLAVVPGQETPAASPSNPTATGPGEADLAIVAARPLFSATRRPPPPDETASVANTPADLSKLQLVGIVGPENAYVAIIEYSQPRGKSVHVRAGDRVEGWLVEAIETRQVIFQQGDASYTMILAKRKRATRQRQRAKPRTPQPAVPAAPGQRAPADEDE